MHCLRDWFHVICISFLLQLRLYFLASIILQQIFSTQQPQVLDSMLLFSVRRNWPLWNTSEGRPWGMRILRSAAPQIPWPLGVGVAGGRSDLSRRIGHQPKWNRNHPTAFVLVPADTSGQRIRYLSLNASLVIPWVIKTERMKRYVCSVPKSFFSLSSERFCEDWPTGGTWEKRKQFCDTYDGYGDLCSCDNPFPTTADTPKMVFGCLDGIKSIVVVGVWNNELKCL